MSPNSTRSIRAARPQVGVAAPDSGGWEEVAAAADGRPSAIGRNSRLRTAAAARRCRSSISTGFGSFARSKDPPVSCNCYRTSTDDDSGAVRRRRVAARTVVVDVVAAAGCGFVVDKPLTT